MGAKGLVLWYGAGAGGASVGIGEESIKIKSCVCILGVVLGEWKMW